MGHHHLLAWLLLLGALLMLSLPWSVALPLYGALLLFGLALSWRLARSVRAPVTTGREAMLGADVRVLRHVGAGWQVRHAGEVWSALSPDVLCPGEPARIVGFEGLKLVVVPIMAGPGAEQAQRLDEARRDLARAVARLQGRMAALAAEAQRRETAARSALPGHEAAARAYLAQKQALLAELARVAGEAQRLQAELARLQALRRAVAPRGPCDGEEA